MAKRASSRGLLLLRRTMHKESMDAQRMRRHNSQQVLRVVKKLGPVSRTDITRHTHLSSPTVGALVGNLVRAGLVEEHGAGASKGGRKPQLVSFNARCGVIVGGNIGTSGVRLVLADMTGNRLGTREVALKTETRPKPLLRRVAAAIRALRRDTVGDDTSLLAAVIGAPGMTDMNRGVVLEAANLEGWVDVPARDMLRDMLGIPVVVDNDVNLAALGEHWRGAGRGRHNFVFITIGTGIGAGIVIDDQIHRGASWHAGEISHLNVDFREWNTDFGAAGYLETHLGGAPRARTKRAPRRERAGAMFDEESVRRLGASIANIATIIDPELIVVGGRVGVAHPELIERLHTIAARIAPNCPEIRCTELGEDAPLEGSLRLGLDTANESLHDLLLDNSIAAA